MKKIISLLLIAMVILTGCNINTEDIKKVANSLSDKLKEANQVESVVFYQGEGINRFGGGCSKEEGFEDIKTIMSLFMNVSSDGEPFEEYKEEGFHKLITPTITIKYKSGESVDIVWDIERGVLEMEGKEYYISKKQAQTLYNIFTKYNPYKDNLQ